MTCLDTNVVIAVHARRRGAKLVTAVHAEFSRVPGLITEDWAADRPGRRAT